MLVKTKVAFSLHQTEQSLHSQSDKIKPVRSFLLTQKFLCDIPYFVRQSLEFLNNKNETNS